MTNCKGLKQLLQPLADPHNLYDRLGCAQTQGIGSDGSGHWRSWVSVERVADNSAFAAQHGDWVPGPGHSFTGPPPWVSSKWPESFCVGDEQPIAPVGTGLSGGGCDVGDPELKGLCAQSAGSVAHCFRHQLAAHPDGAAKTLVNHDTNLLVGCTGTTPGHSASELGLSGALGERGTWLAGDGHGKYLTDSLAHPKVFKNTLLRYRITTPGDALHSNNYTDFCELDGSAVAPAGYYLGPDGGDIDVTKSFTWSDEGKWWMKPCRNYDIDRNCLA